MAPSLLPVPNSTTSYWRSEPHRLDNHRSTPDLPSTVDIAVVGAGYAGASTVYHILKSCRERGVPAPSILILEAREACSGATGRNGGHLKPDPYNRPVAVARAHGIEAGAEVAAFEMQHLSAIKQLVEEEDIDCDFVLTRCIDAFMTDSIFQQMKAGVEMLRKNKVSEPLMRDVFFAEGQKAEQLSGLKGVKACFSYSTGHIFPYKLVLHLLARALDSGRVNLQTHTPVTAAGREPDPRDGRLALETPRGTVRAAKVVFATNAYSSAVLPELDGRIIPVRGICSRITVPQEAKTETKPMPAPLLPNSYIIRRSKLAYEYLVPRLDGSIVVGGGRDLYMHNLDSWYNNVDDDKLIEDAASHWDGYMQRMFHGWDESGARTDKVWTGIMGYSSDGMPYVGRLPGAADRFVLAGFTGHGMPQVFLSARGVAAMVLDPGRAFRDCGVPRVFEPTRARLESSRNVVMDDWKANHHVVPPAVPAAKL
ncbi:FAD dependent oxidoreductase [Xylariaceae sp. FL0804]|nr:FAD dependent oxidoreductase [Xylariaceae sp. FL0804]